MSQCRNAIDPKSYDVLCGRGETINSHAGNRLFRQYVSERKLRYNLANYEEKTEITREILDIIASKGGRFLKKEGKEWVEVSDSKAMKKTSQALREKITNGKGSNAFNVSNIPKSYSGRTSPEIFADADVADEYPNWRQLYNSPADLASISSRENQVNDASISLKLNAKRSFETISSENFAIRQVEQEGEKRAKKIINGSSSPVFLEKYVRRVTLDEISENCEEKTCFREKESCHSLLLQMISPNVLLHCFSFLSVSSQLSLLDVSKTVLSIVQSDEALQTRIRNYLRVLSAKINTK